MDPPSDATAGTSRTAARLDAATAELEAPFAAVDLDAFEANAADLLRRAGGKPVRAASKSIRVRALLGRALHAGLRGVLCFTLPEALWLADHGMRDLVVAYPTVDREAITRLPHPEITVMVDCAAHLRLLPGGTKVCLDVDAGLRLLGGRVRIGAKRSPVRTPEEAAGLARSALEHGLAVDGVMAYEAQIAGVGDRPQPGGPFGGVRARAQSAAIRAMQERSARELEGRRAAVVAAVRAVTPVRFVNGGGTGSIERTAGEHAVTEVTAGSGLYGPTLFDTYRSFRPQPAAFFALPVVRRPGDGVVTALGGGYVASGPPGWDRVPRPLAGRLDRQEAGGEVQTPLLQSGLEIGDRAWFRHAKAGELCERFDRVHLIRGSELVGEAPTYRGEGRCFL
jgi:D-serine deaminase-like pyridoxal phosphate-dependent protein